MKAKTIKKIINKKFERFVESIKDKDVRKLVEKNTICTGGCIASMLMKEDINDFDFYFTNKETVLAVAAYYVTEFKKDNPSLKITVVDVDKMSDGQSADANGEELADIKYYQDRGFTQSGRVGVFCSSIMGTPEQENGILSEREIEIIADVLESTEDKTEPIEQTKDNYKPLFLSPNAISLSNKVQLIMRFYGDASEIHKNFDFVHATSYWASENNQLYLAPKAMESILAKELIYIGSLYPVTSIIRTRKFINRGWRINAGTYLKIMFQISKLDLSNIATLEDQLIGVDIGYFMALINALKSAQTVSKENKERFDVGYDYICDIIDKIFN